MWTWNNKQYGPIGVDLGNHAIKLAQFTADGKRLVEAVRWKRSEPAAEETGAASANQDDGAVDALKRALDSGSFHGRHAVVCLNHQQLFLQNIRVPKGDDAAITRAVHQEAAGRVPFPIADAEIRHLEAADIRQGESVLREVILMACHRPQLERQLAIVERARLRPVAVDVEPLALVRSSLSQFRREEDTSVRGLLVHVGQASTAVVIAQGSDVLFVKYVEYGGRHLDEAVARHLAMSVAEAAALRRHNGDRRQDRRDPEITHSIQTAIRPVLEKLASELTLCVRYHSVTFRGQPLVRAVLGGGEADETLAELLQKRLGMECELSDPFRVYERAGKKGHVGQWDVAAGLALHQAI